MILSLWRGAREAIVPRARQRVLAQNAPAGMRMIIIVIILIILCMACHRYYSSDGLP